MGLLLRGLDERGQVAALLVAQPRGPPLRVAAALGDVQRPEEVEQFLLVVDGRRVVALGVVVVVVPVVRVREGRERAADRRELVAVVLADVVRHVVVVVVVVGVLGLVVVVVDVVERVVVVVVAVVDVVARIALDREERRDVG